MRGIIPKIVVSSGPHLVAISDKVSEQPRTEVSSKIDSIARLPAERRTNPKDQKEKHQRGEVASPQITVVLQGEDHEHKNRAGDEFREEHTSLRHEWLRIGAEDAGSGVLPGNGANIGAALVFINSGFVVAVNDSGTTEAPCYLSASIAGQLTPRESPEDAIRHSHSWVEMASSTASRINSKHDTDAPSEDTSVWLRGETAKSNESLPPRNGLIRAFVLAAFRQVRI